jgi:hypothetical protein
MVVVVIVDIVKGCNGKEEGTEDGMAPPIPPSPSLPSPDVEGNSNDAVFGGRKIFGGVHSRCRKFLDTLISV